MATLLRSCGPPAVAGGSGRAGLPFVALCSLAGGLRSPLLLPAQCGSGSAALRALAARHYSEGSSGGGGGEGVGRFWR